MCQRKATEFSNRLLLLLLLLLVITYEVPWLAVWQVSPVQIVSLSALVRERHQGFWLFFHSKRERESSPSEFPLIKHLDKGSQPLYVPISLCFLHSPSPARSADAEVDGNGANGHF